MKNKKSRSVNYTVEIDGGWWFYKAKSATEAVMKAIGKEKISSYDFELGVEIKAKRGKHEHGI